MSLAHFWQLLANGLIRGVFYALIGVSFSLILTVTGRFHFAWALTFTVAAFVAGEMVQKGYTYWEGAVAGVFVAVVLGILIEGAIYAPLLQAVAPGSANALLTVVVASLGLVIVGENLIYLYWTPDGNPISVSGFAIKARHIGSVHFTNLDVYFMIAAILLIGGIQVLLGTTRLGRSVRAVSVNPTMALVVGINTRRIFLTVFGIGSLLSAVAGIYTGTKTVASPEMGLQPTLYALLIAFLAGFDVKPIRAAAVGLGLGIFESEANLFVSADLTQLLVYVVLFAYAASRSFQPRFSTIWQKTAVG